MRGCPKALVIVNPAAGNGRAGAMLPALKGAFATDADEVFVTLRPGDAEQRARTFQQHPGIIAVGGDGTLHEVLNGMDLKSQFLAILPLGTGNSLGRDLGKPDLARVLEALSGTQPRPVDVLAISMELSSGKRLSRYALTTVGIGYPVDAAIRAKAHFKELGALCYPLAAGIQALFLNRFGATVSFDGGQTGKRTLTGLLINDTRHSGNFPAFPKASIADRAMDCMEMSAGTIRQSLHNLSVLTRAHCYVPAIVRPAERITVALERPRSFLADGEIYDDVIGVDLRILPDRLRLVIPEGAKL